MGLTDDLKKTIQRKVFIGYSADWFNKSTACAICGKVFSVDQHLCLQSPGDGPICDICAQRYTPELVDILNPPDRSVYQNSLSAQEWAQIDSVLESLNSITLEMAKSIARGMIEAPQGHIGLFHLTKSLPPALKNRGETDAEFKNRSKELKKEAIFLKIKSETFDKLTILKNYLIRLGLPDLHDK